MAIDDSSELPSIGRTARQLSPEEIQKETRRKWGVWILKKIKTGITESKKIEDLERVNQRQQIALDNAVREINILKYKLADLENRIDDVESRNSELGSREAQILKHVASVDEKATQIDRIGHVAFGLYEIIEEWIPAIKATGDFGTKLAQHLANLRQPASSYSDGKDISDLISDRDRRSRARWK